MSVGKGMINGLEIVVVNGEDYLNWYKDGKVRRCIKVEYIMFGGNVSGKQKLEWDSARVPNRQEIINELEGK